MLIGVSPEVKLLIDVSDHVELLIDVSDQVDLLIDVSKQYSEYTSVTAMLIVVKLMLMVDVMWITMKREY